MLPAHASWPVNNVLVLAQTQARPAQARAHQTPLMLQER
jgi:hypothetical protein